MDKFLLIDGNSLINRAFYALPPMNNKNGTPTNAVFGFVSMLIKLIERYKPSFAACAFDLPDKTFRHKMFGGYKATRKGMPDELAVQLPLLKSLLSALGIVSIEKSGYEADDIIGTMCQADNVHTLIVTGDRDALQLISDSTTVLLTKRGISETDSFDRDTLLAETGLSPKQIVDYKALCGDSSDNIPGVCGIGQKTALSLLQAYKSLDGVYQSIDSISGAVRTKLVNDKDGAYLSYKLATIDTAVPLGITYADCGFSFPFGKQAKDAFVELGFMSLLKRDIFDSEQSVTALETSVKAVSLVDSVQKLGALVEAMPKQFCIVIGESINIFDGTNEHIINLSCNLLDNGLGYDVCINALKPLLESDSYEKTVFDAKNMLHTLAQSSVSLANYWDVRLAQYLVDVTAAFFSLNELLTFYKLDNTLPAAGLFACRKSLEGALSEYGMGQLYYDIELRLVRVLFDMERKGFCIDTAFLNELGQNYRAELEELTAQIHALSGQSFNINSPKQLGKVLFEDMEIPYPAKSKGYSTNAEILEKVRQSHPIVEKILQYRFISKLNSTYVEGLLKQANNGVVYTEFKQMQTNTGRLSSAEPNLQNIPIRSQEGRNLRKAFVSREGYTLISADYSQIELRLLAALSGDKILIEAFKNGQDIHSVTASQVFDVLAKDVTSEQRRAAKAVNFGIIYGISDFGLAEDLGVSRKKAKEYIERYFKTYPSIKEYLDSLVEFAKANGYAITKFNRLRRLPELRSPQYTVRQFGERAAMNMPLQGTGADIIKLAMVKTHEALVGRDARLILQVHDELVVEARDEIADEIESILACCMESACALSVPLRVDITRGKTLFK